MKEKKMENNVLKIQNLFGSYRKVLSILCCRYPTKVELLRQSVMHKAPALKRIPKALLLFIAILCLAQSVIAKDYAQLNLEYKVKTIAKGLDSPWSMVQVAGDEWLVTERDGDVVYISAAGQSIHNLNLKDLYVKGQGGLMDIMKGPDFDTNGTLFLSYSKGTRSENRIAVVKTQFVNGTFSEASLVFELGENKNTAVHHSAKLLLLPDNTLLLSSGDGFDFREHAQKMSSQMGKVLRINLDGSIPSNNPYVSAANPLSHAIYSRGHRNLQGMVYDTANKRVIAHEHGPAGGDELNVIQPTLNYGWPIITYGKDYSGAQITPFTEYPGMQQPAINWTPSIAPSGMAFYSAETNPAFPKLQQHLLVTTLVDRRLYAIDATGDQFTQYTVFDDIQGRLRDVVIADSGNVAVLTDGGNAELLLISAE